MERETTRPEVRLGDVVICKTPGKLYNEKCVIKSFIKDDHIRAVIHPLGEPHDLHTVLVDDLVK